MMDGKKIKLSVVIARYKENIQWLSDFRTLDEEYDITIYVYDKSPVPATQEELNALFPNINLVLLENLGRESYTYLYHTIMQYASIQAEEIGTDHYILFAQGNVDDHASEHVRHPIDISKVRMQYLLDRINDARLHTVSRVGAMPEDERSYFYMRVYAHQGNTQCANKPFGPWFIDTFGMEPTKTIYWIPGAIFCAKSTNVLLRPREFYENLLKQTETRNPEVGHYLERTWIYIYGHANIFDSYNPDAMAFRGT